MHRAGDQECTANSHLLAVTSVKAREKTRSAAGDAHHGTKKKEAEVFHEQ